MNPQMAPGGWQNQPPPNPMFNGNGQPNNLSNQMAQMNLGPPQQQPQQFPGGPMPGQPPMKQPMPGGMPSMPQMPPQPGQIPEPRPIPSSTPGQVMSNGSSAPPQQFVGMPPPSSTPSGMPQMPGGQPMMPKQPQPNIQPPMSGIPPQQPQQQQFPPLNQVNPGQMQPPQPQQPMQYPPGPGQMPPQQKPQQPQYPQQQQQMPPQPQQNMGPPHMPPPLSQPSNQFPGPPQPGQMPMPGQMPGQNMPGMMHQQQQQQQPGMPPLPQQMRQPQPMGQPQMGMQPGMPPMPGQMPPMPGQMPPGMPPQTMQQPGMPPQPNYPGFNQQQQQPYNQMPGAGGYPGQGGAPRPQLNPEHMPSPITEIAENQKLWANNPFVTNQAGLVPPLVTTKYVTHDQGNSGPRFIRSSMYSIPTTTDIMKQTAVPFALIISPFARAVEGELTPPIVDFGEMGPIRCLRCKAYMSPSMQFIDGGRRFQCLLCKQTTEVPAEYFQHLDHTGQRMDKFERPELVLGTYEFVATKDYCRNNKPPTPPAVIFVLDVSYNNVKSGLVHLMCREMKQILKNLSVDQGHTRSFMKVGFITYNNTVHFYNCKASLAQPQMMIVGDVQEMFMPLLDGFLVDPEESAAVIDALMEQIPAMFGDTRETETILLPAIQAGLEALKASETVGKLLVFHSSLPIGEAPGKLKNREDRKLLGTEKEKTILAPQCNTYNNLGQECVQAGCSVDLFLFNNSYIDIATIGQVSRLTGGEIYKYTYFQADIDGQRLVSDVIKNISRPIAFDAVMRVRTSTGIRPTEFYGHFFMSNTTDMEIASIDCDKSIAIEVKHDDKLQEENIHIQVALLYTSCSGQRRLRVINLALTTCTKIADLYRSCDLDTTVLFFAKQGMFKLLENTPKLVKDNLINRCAQILACYRKNCASPATPGQLILPESLKLLPVYTTCLLKNDAFSGGSDMTCDDRSFMMHYVMSMDLPSSVQYVYPRLIPIDDVDPNETDIPPQVRCSAEKLMDSGAYILENGVYMFMWLGLQLAPEFTQSVFGAHTTQQIDTDRFGLPVYDNPLSKRVRGIVDQIQAKKHRCMRLTLVRQRDKLESVMKHFLVEDRGTDGSASYVDFLCHLHKEIRTMIS